MSEVKWIKLQTDIFDNRKIKQLERLPDGDSLIVIWLKILVLAGATNDNGNIYFTPEIPYTDQLLATEFNRPLPTVQFALQTFERFGMIEIINEIIHVSNWERYQSVDRLMEIREYNRLAKQRSREKQKQLAAVNDKSMTSQRCHETDIDKEKEIDKDSDSNKRKRFTAPTIDEVRAYCQERGNSVDPQHFIAHYEANGWKVGKNPMKDWKAAVRTWEKNGYDTPKKNPKYASSGKAKALSADEWEEVLGRI